MGVFTWTAGTLVGVRRRVRRSGVLVDVSRPTTARRDLADWPFAADDPFNIGIGNAATWTLASDPRTAKAHGTANFGVINGAAQIPSYGIPVYRAAGSDPWQQVHGALIQVPAGAAPASGTDHHMTVLAPRDAGSDYTCYGFYGAAATASVSPDSYTASNGGTGYQLSGYSGHYDGRASSIMQMAGLIRPVDITRGAISHALACILPTAVMKPGYVWPAGSEDSSSGSTYTGGTNGVPMGSVLGIPASVDLSTLGLTAGGLMLATALQNYGAIVVDTGANFAFVAEDTADTAGAGGSTPADFRAFAGQMTNDLSLIIAQLRVLTNQQTSQGALTSAKGWGSGSSSSRGGAVPALG